MPTDDDSTAFPFNQLPEDDQVKEMGKSAPKFNETKEYKEKLIEGMEAINRRNSVAQLVPTKSDAELAQEFKEKVAQVYEPLLVLLNEYDKHGLNMQAGVGKNAFGKYQITQLQVVKVF